MAELSELIGKTLSHVKYVEGRDDEIYFITTDGMQYRMKHLQDCCENVYVESIVGDLEDLVGSPIVDAEEVSNKDEPPVNPSDAEESYTWTFYKFSTVKGRVTIRWYGRSNGYYSEGVSFELKGETSYQDKWLMIV